MQGDAETANNHYQKDDEEDDDVDVEAEKDDKIDRI